tara:strand:+ start:19407 stop:20117 length:711 start_codon:yes stop_codon:yes gene_type:complete
MFDSFLDELHTSIKKHDGSLLELPDQLKEYFDPKSHARIRNWLWDVPGFRRWRVTRLDAGDKLQVLNSVAYPNFYKDKPIMGIDLLWFDKRKKLVAVLDFQPLIQDQSYFDKYFDGLKDLKKRFPDFSNQNNMFSYDPHQYFSPWLIFCKGGLQEVNKMLPEIFTLFLESYWQMALIENNNSLQLSPKEVEDLQINYDKYSKEKDPAHGLFSRFFGEQWTEKYMNQFLFPLSCIKK